LTPFQIAAALVAEGDDLATARAKILDQLEAVSRSAPISGHFRSVGDGADRLRAAMTTALAHRTDPVANPLNDQAERQFVGLSLIELARAHMHLNGVDVAGMSRGAIATQALQSSSDFPAILADVANKSLRQGYDAVPRTFTAFSRRATAPDFKPVNRIQLGEAGRLELVNEAGEFKHVALKDGRESYALATRGQIIAITRKTLVNDDMDALSRIPRLQGVAAAETESDVVYALLTGNVTLADGKALFHADHGNLGASGDAGAPGEATFSHMRKSMRKQKGLDGKTVIQVAPRYVIVPAALETAAEKQLAALTPNDSAKVNVFSGKFLLVAEARLDAASEAAWYGAADPNLFDTIEYCYLEGEEGVFYDTLDNFDGDGIKFKARHDFTAGVVDHRGLYKNNG
jgi:hypothetical protein